MNDIARTLLYRKIVLSIHKGETRQAKIRLYCSFGIALISGFALAAAASWLSHDLKQSGFLQMTSLVFSDGSTIAFYWRDFASSLLEFLPTASLAACLASVVMLLVSLSYVSKYRSLTHRLSSFSF